MIVKSLEHLNSLSRKIADKLAENDCIFLIGEIGVGKTTFTRYLINYLQEKWDKYQKICELDDILPIAKGQINNENIISKKTDKIVFCDTDLLTTATYSKLYFNNYCDPLLDKYSKLNYYDLYLLMDIDIPWVKDDLRDRPNERDIFFNSFKMALEMNNKNYFTVSGSFQKRKQKAIELVNNLLNLQ